MVDNLLGGVHRLLTAEQWREQPVLTDRCQPARFFSAASEQQITGSMIGQLLNTGRLICISCAFPSMQILSEFNLNDILFLVVLSLHWLLRIPAVHMSREHSK